MATSLRPQQPRRLRSVALVVPVLGAVALGSCALTERGAGGANIDRIQNVVVIYAENHSFDNLFGTFPGANGVANATIEQKTQLDHDGKPLKELTTWAADGKADPRFPKMPNGPFRIDAPPINMSKDKIVPGPIHVFYHHIEQINGGRNNMFAAISQVGGWTMGYYDGSESGSNFRLWKWAKEYTLADNFFQAAFGGSYLNHQWLICACTPVQRDAPQVMRVRLEASGKLEKKPESGSANDGPVQILSAGGGQVTPDGYSVNTSQPPYQPSGVPPADGGSPDLTNPAGATGHNQPVPPQTQKTIGDTLTAKGINWAWYGGAWNAALSDGRQPASVRRATIYNRDAGSPNFQPHHQPFNYYARFAPGTPDRARHLKDGEDLLRDIAQGTLPAVAFYKPPGKLTQHPSYTDLQSGDEHMAELLEKLRASPQWKNMLIVLTYDENGGYWDHVPPPSGPGWGDRWGPGSRIPALFVGPTVKKGYIDSTSYDTTSILKFITRRFNLEPLPGVRARAGDLTNALQQP